mmetsp:Transcript_51631/g.129541  ORF Transcript_51631/g.129541 Transcript_51631/m.129541 type:complete len:817 (+) Transcript_51631:186-2636(+)|eukprot:CAMPEP_0177641182 /NCGR_PEP_ID=MMETSP0447-20121125/6933_1 /TAXON_ID=0 /ORGANISM="Stygamoeba regulata, Strain BSH-02190019" /LENGTH=816 /DNA_ID=CAMNT_0019143289 /DNA_START=174 /DNA_END=2624 /DNA_ORIENTATION=+
MAQGVYRLKPFEFIHVLDHNTGVTRLEVGPQTFTRQEHEKVVLGVENFVFVPPRHYCLVKNPVEKDEQGVGGTLRDEFGNYKIRHGDEEIRFEGEPFPLFPGEALDGKITPLVVVPPASALKLRALRDFDGVCAGEEWLFRGPATYIPRVEVYVVQMVSSIVIQPNNAIKLRARKQFVDAKGTTRLAGEQWLVRESGSYLPGVDEEFLESVPAHILTRAKALHLRATRTFVDVFGTARKAGEEWLVTHMDTEAHIPDIFEEVVGEVKLTTLTNEQYCVVVDYVDSSKKQQWGGRQLRRGPCSFFLLPFERLEKGIQSVFVLDSEEALLLTAREAFTEDSTLRQPGDRWMVYGPREYVPPVEVDVLEKRKAIPLGETEGVYVRDVRSGKVRSVIGKSYMLLPTEELWAKEMPAVVEDLLLKYSGQVRDKNRVVTFRALHNTAVQIYDYKDKNSRVVFGPKLVMLGPDEHFTVLSLSGSVPKKPHLIKDLALQLGPDFMTDIVVVETADHARLSLKLSYNWKFHLGAGTDEDAANLFQVPDFVGDACKAIASRVRGAVACESFDNFHKRSARIIRQAVFGVDGNGRIRDAFVFTSNQLHITNIDIQSVEPVDQRTRDALQKSVQLAIEITTKSQEATARHEAMRIEQEARGRLERQKIVDEAQAEKARTNLLQLQAKSTAVETTGQSAAEAKARAEASNIEGEAAVTQAELRAQAAKITALQDLNQMKAEQTAEVEYRKQMDALDLELQRELAKIESAKFQSAVDVIGADTIAAIANAGPETQAKLLQGLGLQSFLITDGKSPVNLFNTAKGLIAGGQ